MIIFGFVGAPHAHGMNGAELGAAATLYSAERLTACAAVVGSDGLPCRTAALLCKLLNYCALKGGYAISANELALEYSNVV